MDTYLPCSPDAIRDSGPRCPGFRGACPELAEGLRRRSLGMTDQQNHCDGLFAPAFLLFFGLPPMGTSRCVNAAKARSRTAGIPRVSHRSAARVRYSRARFVSVVVPFLF